MEETQDQAHKKLIRFAEQLRRLSFPSSTISLDLAEFVASGFERFCRGDAKSLDAAFGLKPKRGAPGDRDKRLGIARKISAMQREGKSWIEIGDFFAEQDRSVTDERTLRRIHKEFSPQLIIEELCRRLDDSGA